MSEDIEAAEDRADRESSRASRAEERARMAEGQLHRLSGEGTAVSLEFEKLAEMRSELEESQGTCMRVHV